MTDPVQEGALVATEAEELAVPQVLESESEVQQPSVSAGGLTEDRINELLEEKLGALNEKLERQAQSAKDRAISAQAKQINDILARLDQLGGNREALIQEADQQELLAKISRLEAQISRPGQPVQTASAGKSWQEEWRDDSQKILDAAAKDGVTLTTEEYNSAMFNNGVKFLSKGDAFAALNRAIIAKTKGESIPIAAVATEGGNVARPPAPPAKPKSAAERFEAAKAVGDQKGMEAAQAERWADIEKTQKALIAKQTLEAAGITAEDLLGQ